MVARRDDDLAALTGHAQQFGEAAAQVTGRQPRRHLVETVEDRQQRGRFRPRQPIVHGLDGAQGRLVCLEPDVRLDEVPVHFAETLVAEAGHNLGGLIESGEERGQAMLQ